jgi:hypothetical protein
MVVQHRSFEVERVANPTHAHGAHHTLDRAPGHRVSLAPQLPPHLPRTVDLLVPHLLNRHAQLVVPPRPRRPRGGILLLRFAQVIGRRSDGQDRADRPTPYVSRWVPVPLSCRVSLSEVKEIIVRMGSAPAKIGRQKETPASSSDEAGSSRILPAATYSPTHLRTQYHRRWQA